MYMMVLLCPVRMYHISKTFNSSFILIRIIFALNSLSLKFIFVAKQRVKHQSPDRAQKLAEYDNFCQKSAAEKQQQRIDDLVVDLTAIHSNEDSREYLMII